MLYTTRAASRGRAGSRHGPMPLAEIHCWPARNSRFRSTKCKCICTASRRPSHSPRHHDDHADGSMSSCPSAPGKSYPYNARCKLASFSAAVLVLSVGGLGATFSFGPSGLLDNPSIARSISVSRIGPSSDGTVAVPSANNPIGSLSSKNIGPVMRQSSQHRRPSGLRSSPATWRTFHG